MVADFLLPGEPLGALLVPLRPARIDALTSVARRRFAEPLIAATVVANSLALLAIGRTRALAALKLHRLQRLRAGIGAAIPSTLLTVAAVGPRLLDLKLLRLLPLLAKLLRLFLPFLASLLLTLLARLLSLFARALAVFPVGAVLRHRGRRYSARKQ